MQKHTNFADHVTSTATSFPDPGDEVAWTDHSFKWDHFEILAKGRSDTHGKFWASFYRRSRLLSYELLIKNEATCSWAEKIEPTAPLSPLPAGKIPHGEAKCTYFRWSRITLFTKNVKNDARVCHVPSLEVTRDTITVWRSFLEIHCMPVDVIYRDLVYLRCWRDSA